MTTKQRSKLKKEIRKIIKREGFESKWTTISELADEILNEIEEL